MRNASVAPIEEAKETITVPQSSPKTAGLPGVREVPRLDRRLLRLDILEGEIARAAGGEESNDGERDEGEDEKPAPAHAASAPPHDDPCPAVQP